MGLTMFDGLFTAIASLLAVWFGVAWLGASVHRKKLEDELSQRRLESAKQHDAAVKAAMRARDEAAKQPPIDTKGRTDFE